MYSIGQFSQINRITPKALRHYERIGLLQPAHTDPWNGYRYYAPEQLPVIQRILMLKRFGFRLSEIKEILSDDSNLETLLEQRERELYRAIRDQRRHLDSIRQYRTHLQEGTTMNEEITIKSLPSVTVASMRTTVPSYDAFFEVVPTMGEYMESVGAVCRDPEYCFTIFHNDEYREHDIDVEICEAVTERRKDSETIRFKEIAGTPTAACIFHRGPYGTIGESYNTLFAWISANGYTPSDHPRESYIDGIWNKDDPNEWLTEVQVPVVTATP